MSKQSLELKSVLENCFKGYQRNILAFVALGILGNFFSILGDVILGPDRSDITPLELIFMSVEFFIWTWLLIPLTILSEQTLQGKKISLKDILFIHLEKFPKLFVATVLYLLGAVVGFILLIVPGIIWITIFTFGYIPIILENKSIIESFKVSKDLIKGYFGSIFLIFSIYLVFSVLSTLLPNPWQWLVRWILGIFSLGFLTLLGVAVYLKLKSIKGL